MAVALMKRPDASAAWRLEALAQEAHTGPARRIAGAGGARLASGQTGRARRRRADGRDQGRAENIELLIDRAGARAALKRYGEAADDLTAASRSRPGADALALRASAKR